MTLLVDGEILLVEHSQKLLTYGAAGTNNCNFHFSYILILIVGCKFITFFISTDIYN